MPKTRNPPACSVETCTKRRHYAKGFCKKHYTQVLRHGRLTPESEWNLTRVCKVEGCGRTDTIQWYCRKHHGQIKRHGRLAPEREHVMGRVGCRVPRCKAAHCAKGLCAKHYAKAWWVERKARRRSKTGKASTRRSKRSQHGRP